MKRRSALGLVLAATAVPARAQPTERVYRVGVLRPSAPPQSSDELQVTGIPRALAELGYAEGRNLLIETRWAGGDPARLGPLAMELVKARVDLIVAVSGPAVQAAQQAAPALPVVMFGNFDPVALGLVDNLARPGGNVTGVLIAPDGTLAGKRLEMLKAAVPQARRIGYLGPPLNTVTRLQLQETRQAAAALGLELLDVEVRDGDYAAAFAALTAMRPGALVVGAHTFFVRDRRQIIEHAAKARLPAIYEWRVQVVDGGLMAYGTSLFGSYQRLARYVDRILKGAKPGELPIERPSKFELVINLKTAKALGLSVPQTLLLRADEVVE